MSQNEKTSAELKAVAAEIDALHQHPDYDPGQWKTRYLEHLYTLPVEAYIVTFENHFVSVYVRDAAGKIMPALGHTYYAPDFKRPTEEEEKEEEWIGPDEPNGWYP